MSGYSRWNDIRAGHVERAGGEAAVAEGRRELPVSDRSTGTAARQRTTPPCERTHAQALGGFHAGIVMAVRTSYAHGHDRHKCH
ncbi:hypothetical protein GCM10009550_20930 [Actinocorallia libanotica]|uniref:Uncharacterized protein n=1 Tax=Actinocorallia libanotica TaxID=46162 RepID=A0ABN1QSS4_9ACTN